MLNTFISFSVNSVKSAFGGKSKLFYIIVSAAIFFASNVYSQHGIALKLGIEGGINLANVSRSSGAATNSITGVVAGGLLDIGISSCSRDIFYRERLV